jgi:hypothetical protein
MRWRQLTAVSLWQHDRLLGPSGRGARPWELSGWRVFPGLGGVMPPVVVPGWYIRAAAGVAAAPP